jgi:hypothetical protein
VAVLVKATSRPGLIAGQFRTGAFHLREGQWTALDATDPAIRADLLKYTPSHVRIAQGQDAELAAAGLSFKDGKLLEVAKAPAPQPPPAPPAKEKAQRAEK